MATNALAVVQPQWAEDQQLLETIKQTVCKGATDAQFRMFVEVCKATGLNPFLNEIWFVPSVGVMAGRDAYLRKANEHPQFDGMETRVERNEQNIPIKAVCTVWRKDRGHPIIAEAYYNEYKKGGNVWSTYPSAMIAKVAEVLALKRSFAINGVVTEEEIGNGQERGSKEAQQEYLASKGIETTKPIDEFTERQAKLKAEGEAILNSAASDPKPNAKGKKHGIIPFDKLRNWQKLKDEIRSFTGTDGTYYGALQAKGYNHANEITSEADAMAIWKVLGAELNRLKQNAELLQLLEVSRDTIGARVFADLIGLHGCLTGDDVLALASDPLQALLAELKAIVDEKKGVE